MPRVKLPNRRLRLAFLGTPEIAATMLAGLLDADQDDVCLVICQPDRAKGRGKKMVSPPVKALAVERGIDVIQPRKLKDGAVAAQLRSLELDLAIVVAYGRILPKDVFEAPAHDTWNVHASLLPRHRGASPIQHAILTGDDETGVTLMQLSEGMDEGPMLLKRSERISDTATAGSLFESMAALGRDALLEGISLAKSEGLEVTPQPEEGVTYAPMIEKKDGALDLTAPADVLARRVRAFSPWPGTFVRDRKGQPLKITGVSVVDVSGAPGTVHSRDPLIVTTGDGGLRIDTLQPAGKKPMPASAYLNGAGRDVEVGDLFSPIET